MNFCLFHCGTKDKYSNFPLWHLALNLNIIHMVTIKYAINFNLFHCGTYIIRYASMCYFIIMFNECLLHYGIWDRYIFLFSPIPLWHLALNLNIIHMVTILHGINFNLYQCGTSILRCSGIL